MQSATTTSPDFLIDTAAINAKYSAISADPRRWHTGTFCVPVEVAYRSEQFVKIAQATCAVWIEAMRKKGWDLLEAPRVYGPHAARDLDSGLVILGQHEYRIQGAFQLASTPQHVRVDVPPGLVKRDPEHTISLSDAIRAAH